MTIAYDLVATGAGGFGFDLALGGAVPEPATWALLIAGLGFAGWQRGGSGAGV